MLFLPIIAIVDCSAEQLYPVEWLEKNRSLDLRIPKEEVNQEVGTFTVYSHFVHRFPVNFTIRQQKQDAARDYTSTGQSYIESQHYKLQNLLFEFYCSQALRKAASQEEDHNITG